MADWQILRGQMAVLSACYRERTKARLDTWRFWIIAVIAFLTLMAAIVGAGPIVKGWF
jgi:hypothetical protein